MILKRSLKGIEYLHATLFFAILVPFLYALVGLTDPMGTGVLYLKCLLIVIPVAVTEQAEKRVKSFISYFVVCMLLLAGVGGITGLIVHLSGVNGKFEIYEICYCVGMLAETLLIVIMRFRNRVKVARWKKEQPFTAKEVCFLDCPSPSLIWYFVVFYLIGLFLSAKPLCDTAFYSAVVYTFLVLFYEYFRTTKAYLAMNKRTRGIPKRRLYGISFSMFLVFGVFLLIGMIPAVVMAGHRQYIDIRDWLGEAVFIPYVYESDMDFQPPAPGGMDIMEILNDGRPAPEPSKIANAVLWVIGTVCIAAFLYGIFEIIKQMLLDFRNSQDENGDIVEAIEDEQSSAQKEDIFNRKGLRGFESEAERIRRKYRKTIRRHRKELPAPYESPSEIEEYAGLKDDEQMQQLHREYERVRYGRD